jgi:Domain of unknown function (DUF5667)
MKKMGWRIILWLGVALNAQAGHGLLNSFAGIEWLPPAGITPAERIYRIARWWEEIQFALAGTPAQKLSLSLSFARERLAEIEGLIRTDNSAAARPAIADYAAHLAQASTLVARVSTEEHAAQLLSFATVLLEHQYIVSTDYLELPRESRGIFSEIIKIAAKHYAVTRTQLPRRTRDSLFFKEEEVRWSWEQALGADAQGL